MLVFVLVCIKCSGTHTLPCKSLFSIEMCPKTDNAEGMREGGGGVWGGVVCRTTRKKNRGDKENKGIRTTKERDGRRVSTSEAAIK